MSQRGAIGRAKAMLPFGHQTLLERIVDRLSLVVPLEGMVIVAAADQPLPRLPAGVQVARDRRPDCGPLEGLATGFAASPAEIDAVYATSCDVPLLVPPVVDRLFSLLAGNDVAVPRDTRWYHPLSAVYRRSVLPQIEMLLESGERRPRALFPQVQTLAVEVETLRDVDPDLETLANVNTPSDYRAALARARL